MSDVSHFIKMLQSENHNNRYNACEELRVWKSPLPQEAIDALQVATNDLNPDVADAAQRALSLHTTISYNEVPTATNITQKENNDARATHKTITLIYVFVTILILIVNCWAFSFGLAVGGWQAIIDVVLIPLLIVAGCIYISKYFINQNNTKLGYIVLFSAPILVWLYFRLIGG